MTETASDARQPGWFVIDNEVIDNYQLSTYAGWLYAVIIRHVNHKSGMAFPGLSYLAEKAGMTEPTAIKYLYELVDKRLVCIYQTQDTDGSYFPNHYELLQVVKAIYQGGKGDLPGVVKDVKGKKTKPKKTEEKDKEKDKDSAATPPAVQPHIAIIDAYWVGLPGGKPVGDDYPRHLKIASQMVKADVTAARVTTFMQVLYDPSTTEFEYKKWRSRPIPLEEVAKLEKVWWGNNKPADPVYYDFSGAATSTEEQHERMLAYYATQEAQEQVREDVEARGGVYVAPSQ